MKRLTLAGAFLTALTTAASATYVPGTDPVVQNNTGTTATAAGTPADAAYTGTGSGSIIAVLKGLYAALAGTLAVQDSAAEASLSTIASQTSGVATAANQATANSSLSTTATNTGTTATAAGAPADAAWSGSGSGSIIAVLKGLYAKLAGTLAVQDSAAEASLSTIASQTTGLATAANQATANSSLSTTATNTGTTATNTGTTATNTTAVSTATGTTADAAWSGSGNSTVIAGLKAIYGKLAASLPASLGQKTMANSTGVVLPSDQIVNVSDAPVGTSSVSPTVQAAAYAGSASAPVVIGGLLSFTSATRTAAGSGLAQSVTVSFVSGIVPLMDVILFNANPSGSTVTDRSNLSVATADLGKIIGVMHVSDCTLLGTTTPSVCQAQQQALPFALPSGQTIYAAIVTRSSVTLGSTSDVTAILRTVQN